MKTIFVLPMKLNLFEGEGAGGETTAAPVTTQQAETGEEAVVYGKQTSTETPDAGENKPEAHSKRERKKAFRQMIRGEYKDLYTEETQRMINRRFTETEELKQQVEGSKALTDMLFSRYGISDGDMAKLTAAVQEDRDLWAKAADEHGMTTEQYIRFQKLQQQNAALERQQEVTIRQQMADEQVRSWLAEADALKEQFPDFDFEAEMENDAFRRTMQAGVPMEMCYKLIHYDAMMSDAVMAAQADTEKAVSDNIRARGNRPQENGTAAKSAFTVKDDVSKLTKADRAEIARRVARGEIISF